LIAPIRRFSATENSGTHLRPSGTSAIPFLARRKVDISPIELPSNSIDPS